MLAQQEKHSVRISAEELYLVWTSCISNRSSHSRSATATDLQHTQLSLLCPAIKSPTVAEAGETQHIAGVQTC